MIRIQNQVIDAVKMKWDSITFPLKAGTPISIGGVVANNKNAIGIVMQDVKTRPAATEYLFLLVGGDVLLKEVEQSAGITLTKDAKASMSAIRFFLPNGKVDDSADQGYTLPAATESKLGGVKIGTGVNVSSDGTISVDIPTIPVAGNVAASEAADVAGCVTSINAILTALKTAGLMEADE